MKRSITDFFGSSPTKKAKVAEDQAVGVTHTGAPASPAKVLPQAVPKTVRAPVPLSSSNDLTDAEAQMIETNRKKALARQLLQRIIEPSWKEALEPEFEKPYMLKLADFLAKERASTKIYPPDDDLFTALNLCPLDSVKVVMLGQDPYHGPNQAHGLCFSALPPTKVPPSLRNMYKELKANYPDITIPTHGNLEYWASQGILMLNAVLTVRAGQADSHQNQGWEQFTDACISLVSKRLRSVVFLLWGSKAQKKAKMADGTRHNLLKAAHPSPLSSHAGFDGCKHFSETNAILKRIGRTPIDWQLPKDGTAREKPMVLATKKTSEEPPAAMEGVKESSETEKEDKTPFPTTATSEASSAPNGDAKPDNTASTAPVETVAEESSSTSSTAAVNEKSEEPDSVNSTAAIETSEPTTSQIEAVAPSAAAVAVSEK